MAQITIFRRFIMIVQIQEQLKGDVKEMDLKFLEEFHDRQVVVNFYEEEMMCSREGFFFDTIHVRDQQISFHKDGQPIFELDITPYQRVEKMPMFSDHYALLNLESRVEVYFPH